MPKRVFCPQGHNLLLFTLSPADRAALEPHLSAVDLPARRVLDKPGAPIRDVVFPVTGVGSMIAIGPEDREIEAGLFGCEGMSGLAVVTGGDRLPNRTLMQLGGAGRRVGAGRLRALMEARPTLRMHLLRFVQAMFVQTSQTALSNGHAKLEERLARWLLMCHDRMPGDGLDVTHDFLAVMLGVRRAGVTVGLHLLEGKRLIRAERGHVTVLDRAGLEAEARSSYGASEAECARLFGTGERPAAPSRAVRPPTAPLPVVPCPADP